MKIVNKDCTEKRVRTKSVRLQDIDVFIHDEKDRMK